VTAAEVALLCRFVRAACPSQPWDEYTAEAWEIILPPGYTLDECRDAVVTIVRRGARFIDPGAVITEVRRLRDDAAERGKIAILRDPAAYRAAIEAADAQRRSVEAVVREIAIRAGRPAGLRAVPPPDYDGPAAIEAGR
jgi:hypothetical protein